MILYVYVYSSTGLAAAVAEACGVRWWEETRRYHSQVGKLGRQRQQRGGRGGGAVRFRMTRCYSLSLLTRYAREQVLGWAAGVMGCLQQNIIPYYI